MWKGAAWVFFLATGVGCGSQTHDADPSNGTGLAGGGAAAQTGGSGGSGGSGGAIASGGAAGAAVSTAGTAGVGGAAAGVAGAAPCPEVPSPAREGGSQVDLTFVPLLEGKPFPIAEAANLAGGTLTPLNVRFYVSEVALQQADGTAVPVDLLSASGTPQPYGIQLVNFDEPASTTLHFKAPPGSYSGARFTLGMNDACNSGSSSRSAPLSVNSEMVWPHLAGYLFLRYEAQWLANPLSTAAAPPTMIHMGGTVGRVFAPQASVSGALTVPAAGSLARNVKVSFDEIFRGASSTEEVTNVLIPDPEVIAGERLRRAVPTAAIFELSDP